jgi:hypothetical protein
VKEALPFSVFRQRRAAQGSVHRLHSGFLKEAGQAGFIAVQEQLGLPQLLAQFEVVLEELLELQGLQAETAGAAAGGPRACRWSKGVG